ncbi:hypothetical protein M885DRAFT_617273 [Pelagophyceae sp. CCMP2097]|nr:hypothetical protein M885DRAFT_617273 [Pelagophyceae sp. CCMP2097]
MASHAYHARRVSSAPVQRKVEAPPPLKPIPLAAWLNRQASDSREARLQISGRVRRRASGGAVDRSDIDGGQTHRPRLDVASALRSWVAPAPAGHTPPRRGVANAEPAPAVRRGRVTPRKAVREAPPPAAKRPRLSPEPPAAPRALCRPVGVVIDLDSAFSSDSAWTNSPGRPSPTTPEAINRLTDALPGM